MWRISIVLLICVFAVPALSNPPAPTPSNAEQNPQTDSKDKQGSTSTDLHGTETSPVFIKVIPPLTIEPRPSEHSEQGHWYSSPEWWLVIITGLLTVVTAILAGYTAQLWGSTKALAEEAKETSDRQAIDMKASLQIARESADAAMRTAQHMQSADRAYIKISHAPTGLIFNDPTAQVLYGTYRTGNVTIDVSNIGKTPARITGFVKTHFILPNEIPLPPIPLYDSGAFERPEVRTTMYATDAMTPKFKINLSTDEYTAIHAKTSRLYLLMYADYIDQFGIRHRAGYARRYAPQSTGNNLDLVTQRDYNYDRPRQKGEGDDWDEPV